MRSYCTIKDEIVGKVLMKKCFIIDDVDMLIDKLFLKRSIVSFDISINGLCILTFSLQITVSHLQNPAAAVG